MADNTQNPDSNTQVSPNPNTEYRYSGEAISPLQRQMQGDGPPGLDPEALKRAQEQDKTGNQSEQKGSDEVSTSPKRSTFKKVSDQKETKTLETSPETDTEFEPESDTEPKVKIPDWRPKNPKAAEQWDQLKSVIAARDQEIAKLKANQNEVKETPELEELRKERDQYKEIVKQAAIERDPEFNQKYDTRRNQIINQAKLAAGPKGEELEKLMKAPPSAWRDSQIDSIVGELEGSALRRVNAALQENDRLEIERAGEIEYAKSQWESRQQNLLQQNQQQQTQELKKREQAFNQMLSEYQKPGEEGFFLYQVNEDGSNKEDVQKSVQVAQQVLRGELSPEDQARAALIVGSAERLFSTLQEIVSERDQLRAQLEKISNAEPGDGTNSSSAPTKSNNSQYGDQNYDKDFISRLEEARKRDLNPSW